MAVHVNRAESFLSVLSMASVALSPSSSSSMFCEYLKKEMYVDEIL